MKEEEKELRNELDNFRKQKKTGARSSNKSASQDYCSTVDTLNDKVCISSLHFCCVLCRSRCSALALVWPMPVISLSSPLSSRCGRSHDFSSNGHAPEEEVRDFLFLSLSHLTCLSVWNPETLTSMQHECSSSILQGLHECITLLLICVYMHLPGTVSQVNKALMNYKNYARTRKPQRQTLFRQFR